jgi:predicted HTH domain antitoxin
VEVSLYDNGTIDNDTVSVYLNNRLIVNKQQLSDRPIQFKVNFDKEEDVLELILFAENLGDVPPNTSLMIVKDGDKVHEVKLTSNERKNAVVRFKRGKPD